MASFADQVRKANIENKDSEILTNSIKSKLKKVKTNKKDFPDLNPAKLQKIKTPLVNKPVKDNEEITTDLQGSNKQVRSTQQGIRTTEQPSNRTTGQVPEQLLEQVSEQLLEQPNNRATEQVSEQPNNRATEQLPEQPSKRTTEQVPKQPNSLYIDRKIDYNNLSIFLENSEFWKKDLSIRKCKTWLNEFEDLTPEDLLRELQIGEKHPVTNKPNKSKLGLFYIAIKNGGLSKPKGFEFPEEKRLRKRKEKLEIELRAQKELEEIEIQALELENKKSFELEIKNPESLKKLINELLISKSFFKSTRTKKSLEIYKKTGELDLTLKTFLRKEYLKN